MRNQWRFLLRQNLLSSPRFTRSLFQHQVSSSSSSSAAAAVVVPFSSTIETSTLLFQSHHFHRFYSSSTASDSKLPETSVVIDIISKPLNDDEIKNELNSNNELNFYSSSTASNSKLPETSVVIDIFSKPLNDDEIKNELNSNNVILTCDLVIEVLEHLSSEPATAIKLFNWVSGQDLYKELLKSTSYNLMLGTLGGHGYVKEFWVMVDAMKEKGFGIKRGAFDRTLERFKKDGLQADVEKLHGLFVKKSTPEALSYRINRILRRSAWDESSENDLKGLDISYSTEFVKMVLEKVAVEPLKRLIFFRWLEASGVFKHDQTTYNVMAVVLGREDYVYRFWDVVEDMRNAGYELELRAYVKVLQRFIDRKMMKDAVALFEIAMNGANKPSRQDCVFLLKKLAVASELDMELFSRVVKAFTEKGFALDEDIFVIYN